MTVGSRDWWAGEPLTRRRYLTIRALAAGAHPLLVREAVASVALEHPEWDMTEERTWAEWEKSSE